MATDWDYLSKALGDPTRRRILLLLYQKGTVSYTDIMVALDITNTGKLNYHLKILGDLIRKDGQGNYVLTEKGVHAASLLREPIQPTPYLNQSGSAKPRGTARTVGGILLIILGAFMVLVVLSLTVALPVFLSYSPAPTAIESASWTRDISPHTSFLFGPIPLVGIYNGSFAVVNWTANTSVTLYVLTAQESLSFFNGSTIVDGTPPKWLQEASGDHGTLNVSSEPPNGLLYLAVSSNNSAYVDSTINIHQTTPRTTGVVPWPATVFAVLPFASIGVLGVLGVVLIFIGVRLLRQPSY
jgi:hypothetical protein